MSGLDECRTPEGNTPVIKAPASRPPSSSRTTAQILADQLHQSNYIGSFTIRGPNNPRFIELNCNEIFNALRDLYSLHFTEKWDILKKWLSSIGTPPLLRRLNTSLNFISHIGS